MNWADLTPVAQRTASPAQMPSHTCRGLYAEFDASGEYRTPRQIAHAIWVGQISAEAPGVVPAFEYLRLSATQGPRAVPDPERLLTKRPRWYAMVNVLDLADEWALIAAGRPAPLGKPWWRTAVFVLAFPLLFPLQFTNGLALRVAPLPKSPREITDMHEADLRELARQASASRPRHRPAIRVNGGLIDPDA